MTATRMPTCLRSLPGRTKKKEDEDEDEDEEVGGGARERETESRRQRKAEKPGRGTGGRARRIVARTTGPMSFIVPGGQAQFARERTPLATRKEERRRERERERGEPMARRPGLYEWAIAMQPFASFVSYLSPFIIIRPHPIYTRDPRSTLYTA